ncbi:D-sedoheptulose 7-phosphate isomerase [bacterium]|jgi:D-sedoheptulose 7-phosphate isomerase|nr:D-sedoheptulose 7-phosphate isomerase [Flavobacteriales bacterium]MDA7762819.1 D-sedoheptulose 7-phosphate isomerase [Crocinitomicaceae bacterium]MDA9020507.1 D-sedoheptulose 7-phosphate isomerase [bacterium]MBT5933654.1 D-sedoheptulose 7-phosphate isomerase [Flavobacteriales bacterium]MDC0302418.1 D-sedoheptulose 7-phosphate isomerase [bacterium]
MSNKDIKKHFEEALEVLSAFNTDENLQKIEHAIKMLSESIDNGNKIISCGNGGSMCDAMHFAEELSGRFRNDRKGLAAVSISDPSHISCVANDYGYEYVFSRYIEALGNTGDVLLGISTSGNSKNVIKAVELAKSKGIRTIVLTGKTGGKLAEMADLEIRAPHSEYADRAQEIHIKVIHALIDGIEKELNLA